MHRLTLMTLVGVASIAASCVYLLAAPVTLLNDTFDSPGATRFDDANDPLDVAHYGFTGSLAVNDGYLRATTATANARFGSATFAAATLANVGDTVAFHFDVRGIRAGGQTGLFGLDFGLYGSGGTGATDDSAASRDNAADDRGILAHLWDDAGNSYSSILQLDASGQTLAGESGTYVGAHRFADGGWHSYDIGITRTATGLIATFSHDGSTPQATQISSSNLPLTFDNIQFGTGATPFELHLDNLRVSYTAVPEPTTLATMATLSIALRRRRR